MNLLIIGGTGTLGRQIVKKALDNGYQVTCLVRSLRRGNFLKEWGAELTYGDLSVPETIPTALKDIDIIIDASTVRPTDSYNAETIDGKGKIALIEAAKLAKIERFIFFSMINAEKNADIPLINLKLEVEKRLKDSGLNYTIFHCAGFFQGLINQYAVPLLEKQTIWLLGNSAPVAYLDTQDAAEAVVNSLQLSETMNQNLLLKGDTFWSSEKVIEILFGHRKRLLSYVSVYLERKLKFLMCHNLLLDYLDDFFVSLSLLGTYLTGYSLPI